MIKEVVEQSNKELTNRIKYQTDTKTNYRLGKHKKGNQPVTKTLRQGIRIGVNGVDAKIASLLPKADSVTTIVGCQK